MKVNDEEGAFEPISPGFGWFVILPEGFFKKYETEFEARLFCAGEPKARFIGNHPKYAAAMRAAFQHPKD